MADKRAHVITGGFPLGSPAGHDQDYARLRLLTLLAEQDVPATVGNDFTDIARFLPISRLLITYVAGPYPDAAQCEAMRGWLESGGHWVALHGTSGGRAQRVEGHRMRRTIKTEHHALLGGFFLTHPPLCGFTVDVNPHALTEGVGTSFRVEDEPYFVELQNPATAQVLLTANYGFGSDAFPILYPADTSPMADGKTRVLGYNTPVGAGSVTYYALGHCHGPTEFRGPWESSAFTKLLRNAISY